MGQLPRDYLLYRIVCRFCHLRRISSLCDVIPMVLYLSPAEVCCRRVLCSIESYVKPQMNWAITYKTEMHCLPSLERIEPHSPSLGYT